jgi:hypothetical protein
MRFEGIPPHPLIRFPLLLILRSPLFELGESLLLA